MYLADQRVFAQARASVQQTAEFEVVMLGHCGGKADLSQLHTNTLAEISALGLVEQAEALKRIQKGEVEATEQQQYLYDIPIPIVSLADFQVLFPQAGRWKAAYKSELAADYFWSPNAIADFFNETNPLATGIKKLWFIRVAEAKGQNGFLPEVLCNLTDFSSLKGLHLALLPPNAGLIVMPDLERIQIPQQLEGIPRVRLENPEPAFLPCSQKQPMDDGHRERRNNDEMLMTITPWETKKIIANIMEPIHRYRPDMQCLWTLGLQYQASRGAPSISTDALKDLKTLRTDSRYSQGLHRIQFIFPYLRTDELLYSASGLLAGQITSQTERLGAWRSIAGIALADNCLPFPVIDHRAAAQLRETHGLGILVYQGGRTYLDDERLASPYSPKFGQAVADDSAQRSGEFVRFMGFLQRQLLRLGERILFSLDPLDPRPKLLLEQFFNRLHELGALRGGVAGQAYSIEQVASEENVLKYEIQIAPAFSIDRIRLSFSHQQGENNLSLNWEGF